MILIIKCQDLKFQWRVNNSFPEKKNLKIHNIQVLVDERGIIVHPVDIDKLMHQVCNTKHGLDMSIHDIRKSHVIGKVTNNKSPVIFKFLYRIRNSVYTNKRALKRLPTWYLYN